MGKLTGLARRNGIYYYRTRIPKDLVEHFGRKEVWVSLGTAARVEAETRARVEAGKWGGAFAQSRMEIAETVGGQSVAGATASAVSPKKLSRSDIERLAREWFRAELQKLDSKAEPTHRDLDPDDAFEVRVDLGVQEATLEASEDPNTLIWTRREAERLVEKLGLQPNELGAEIGPLMELIRRAMLQLVRIDHARFVCDYSDGTSDPLFAHALGPGSETGFTPIRSSRTRKTLGDVAEEFWSEEFGSKAHSSKTTTKYRAALDVLLAHFGKETPISEVDRASCRAYRDLIGRLPPNFSKRFPEDTSLTEIAAKNVTGELGNMARDTQTTYLSIMARLFSWATREGVLTNDPATGIASAAEKVPLHDRRNAFSTAQLTTIFNAPLYRGSVDDERGFATPGLNIIRRSRFWVPLLALYSGARLGELLQLQCSDVRYGSMSNTPYFLIHADDPQMRLKTASAKREVPLHPELVRIGFLLFVEGRKEQGAKLLFDDIPKGPDGYRSSTFSKRFATFLRSLGIPSGAKISFHSFRHTFRDALRRGGVPEESAEAICGWTRSKVSRSYGQGFDAANLYNDICRVEYPGLDLGHLHVVSDGGTA